MCSHYQIETELDLLQRPFGILITAEEWREQRKNVWPGLKSLMSRRPRDADVGNAAVGLYGSADFSEGTNPWQ